VKIPKIIFRKLNSYFFKKNLDVYIDYKFIDKGLFYEIDGFYRPISPLAAEVVQEHFFNNITNSTIFTNDIKTLESDYASESEKGYAFQRIVTLSLAIIQNIKIIDTYSIAGNKKSLIELNKMRIDRFHGLYPDNTVPSHTLLIPAEEKGVKYPDLDIIATIPDYTYLMQTTVSKTPLISGKD